MGKEQIKCLGCDREFSEEEALEYPGKVHVHQGKVMCEDCLVNMGVLPETAQPYALYRETAGDPRAESGI